MEKTLVLHHTSFNLPDNFNYNESLAGCTHMSNLNAEIPFADFCSFIYLRKTRKIVRVSKFAPWYYFKWLTILLRIIFLIKLIKSYDKIIIYHSRGFYFYLPFLLIFRRKIILQVNEIFSVVGNKSIFIYIEKIIISLFPKLIVSNIHLKNDWFKAKDVLVRGGYFNLSNSDNVHDLHELSFIYVGSIDEKKMGNFSILLDLIGTIPDNVLLTLCLITDDYYFDKIIQAVEGKSNIDLNRNIPEKSLGSYYFGTKFGLVLQDGRKPFNLTSFPSKVFSYLNNDVIPIAERNESFSRCEINDLFCYIDKWEWKELVFKCNVNGSKMINDYAIKMTNDLHEFISK